MPLRPYPWRPIRIGSGKSSGIDWAYISTYSGPRGEPKMGHWIGRVYSNGERWSNIRGLSFASSQRIWFFCFHRRKMNS